MVRQRIVAPSFVGSIPISRPNYYFSIVNAGESPSGKARDFDSRIRRFESCHPSHMTR